MEEDVESDIGESTVIDKDLLQVNLRMHVHLVLLLITALLLNVSNSDSCAAQFHIAVDC